MRFFFTLDNNRLFYAIVFGRDCRSFDVDYEIYAVFCDYIICVSFKVGFERHKNDRIQLDYTQWKLRPLVRRFKESVACLLGSVL